MRLSVIASCCLLLACTSSTTAPTASEPSDDTALTSYTEATPRAATTAMAGTSLGSVALQNHIIGIESGEAGVRYSVESNTGAMIAESLTQAELKLQFPDLFKAFETATASADNSDEPRTIDASLTPGAPPGPRLTE